MSQEISTQLTLDFTALLQEPEVKWRPVADSRGVAIHQLNTIDKTLVVFRAEAVFVGVGIWDLFATIGSPGARLVWDKTHEDATLLDDVNELTDLWHIRSKAAWPVAARDSVMLRTTYKSPSSVHVFGFSVDNTELFPRIPPSIDPAVIRTQIDLQGWSIESLSPNTTQVTLLEQSDPRGWSNKSSIPQIMMNTLAGIGEFAIKHGAPPVATRLGGAKALASRYDVEKEIYRFEYESAEARRSTSSSTATSFPLPVAVRIGERRKSETGSLKSLEVSPRVLSNLECEIRCDAETWPNSFAIVIDPPPSMISALKRNRVSSGGGGLWLTIEHDPLVHGKEKIAITIRRGTTLPGARTSVTINGSKVRIDVEDLAEAEVKLLKKQKRGRPSRAPLDQPPALGTLRQRQSMTSVPTISAPSTPELNRTFTPSSPYTRLAMPFSRWYSAAAETTRAAIGPMATPSGSVSMTNLPVDAAVRALTQLARMHADRDGESTEPLGWQPVSDRDGLKVERRIVPHVSETMPVFRAGRIIEGFTAEEVSAVVSSLRKDERFEKPLRLQSFAHGIITSHLTAHTTFPFRSRSMLVVTIVVRSPDAPPQSPALGPPAALSTIFHASSSSFDPKTVDFDPIKYDPTAPIGNLILEGWILETIDPYSHEHYAIPSTRCMYVAAADYSGSIPLSVNNLLNASLPRSLLAVEWILKTRGPPSRARLPPMFLLAPESTAQGPWGLEGIDKDRTGVDQRNEGDEYSLTVTIQPSAGPSSNGDSLHPGLKHTDSRTSVQSSRSTVIDLAEDIRRGRKDFAVMEVELGSVLIKRGYDIQLRAVSLPVALHITANDTSTLPFTLPNENLDLPFRCTIIALAPSVLQSASLDPTSQARHLLRVTLPTSGYEAPIADPLTGKTIPSPRPRWLLDLINDGAVVQLRLLRKLSKPPIYTFGGVDLAVEDEKKTTTRKDSKDMARSKLPQLVK